MIFQCCVLFSIETCFVAAWVVVACVFVIMLLLIHHKLDHSDRIANPSHFIEDPCDQWFQWSDVCNWRTWNHETFIICLFVIAVSMCLVIYASDCV